MRIALGAGRWRLLRQSLLEGLLLSIVGAAGGLARAMWACGCCSCLPRRRSAAPEHSSSTRRSLPLRSRSPRSGEPLLSLAPALELFRGGADSRRRLAVGALSVFGARSSAAPVRYRVRATLVAVQIALSVVLLIGAASWCARSSKCSVSIPVSRGVSPDVSRRVSRDPVSRGSAAVGRRRTAAAPVCCSWGDRGRRRQSSSVRRFAKLGPDLRPRSALGYWRRGESRRSCNLGRPLRDDRRAAH